MIKPDVPLPKPPPEPKPGPETEPPPPLPPEPKRGALIEGRWQQLLHARHIREWVAVGALVFGLGFLPAGVVIVAFGVGQIVEFSETALIIQHRVLELRERQDERYQRQADAHDARLKASSATHGQLDGVAQDLKETAKEVRKVAEVLERMEAQ